MFFCEGIISSWSYDADVIHRLTQSAFQFVSVFPPPAGFSHRKQLCRGRPRIHRQRQDHPAASVHSRPLLREKFVMQHRRHPTAQNWGLQYCSMGCLPEALHPGESGGVSGGKIFGFLTVLCRCSRYLFLTHLCPIPFLKPGFSPIAF